MKGKSKTLNAFSVYSEMLHNDTLLAGMAQGVAKGSSY